MTDDVRKLLGGYATGTLTEDETKALLEAALHDDALFAALADEHALKELLDDSAIRAQVLQATEDPRFSILGALREWFDHPKSKALVATAAVLLIVIAFTQTRQSGRPFSSTSDVAELRRPAEIAPAFPVRNAAPQASQAARTADGNRTGATAQAPKPEQQPIALKDSESSKEVARQASAQPPPPAPTASAPAAVEDTEKSAALAEAGAAATGRPIGRIGSTASAPSAVSLRSADTAQPSPPAATPSRSVGAGAQQRAAGTAVTPLRYELLRREAAGAFQAVPADYLFAPGDIVRLRVNSSRIGAIAITSNSATPTVSQPIPPDTWTEVPASDGIRITADTFKLVVAFVPGNADALTGNLLETDETRAKRATAPSVTLEIPIRQKKP